MTAKEILNRSLLFWKQAKGRMLLGREKWDEAIESFTRVIEQDPNDFQAYNNRGFAYQGKGEYDHAIKDYDKVIELEPNNATVYYHRGAAYQGKGKYDRAIKDYDKAIKLKLNNAEVYTNRGTTYQEKGEFDRAIEDYDKAIKLDPRHKKTYYNRGFVYQKKKKYDLAIKDYDKAIKLDPKNATIYTNCGDTYVAKKDFKQAIENYNKAIDLNPRHAAAYNGRGNAYKGRRKFEQAIEDYKKVLEIEPDNETIKNDLAFVRGAEINKKKREAEITQRVEQGEEKLRRIFEEIFKQEEEFEKKHNQKIKEHKKIEEDSKRFIRRLRGLRFFLIVVALLQLSVIFELDLLLSAYLNAVLILSLALYEIEEATLMYFYINIGTILHNVWEYTGLSYLVSFLVYFTVVEEEDKPKLLLIVVVGIIWYLGRCIRYYRHEKRHNSFFKESYKNKVKVEKEWIVSWVNLSKSTTSYTAEKLKEYMKEKSEAVPQYRSLRRPMLLFLGSHILYIFKGIKSIRKKILERLMLGKIR